MKYYSLITKIVASLTLVGGLFYLAFFITLESLLSDFEKNRINDHSKQTEALLSSSISPLMFAEDYATLQKVVDTISLKDEHLHVLEVFDDSKNLLADFYRDPEKKPSKDLIEQGKANTDLELSFYEYPITISGQELGSLRFGLDNSVYAQLKQQLKGDIAYLVAISLLVSFLLIVALLQYQMLGLRRLAQATKRIEAGDYSERLESVSRDEIGLLSDRFNSMADAIKQRNTHLIMEQNRLRSLLETMKIGVLFENKEHKVEYSNQYFRDIWLVDESSVTDEDSLHSLIKKSPIEVNQVIHANTLSPGSFTEEFLLSDNRIILQTYMTVSHKHSHGHLWMFEDITEERRLQSELQVLATTDSLTGLYNRHFFKDELIRMAAYAKRHKKYLALILLDLDEFKIVNDRFGHEAGDEVLVKVANKLKPLIRQEEWLCRLGGDEFALISISDNQEKTEMLINRLLSTLQNTYHEINGHKIQITTSVGVAFYPTPTESIESIVSHADIAMYQAKERGKNTYSIYDPEMDKVDSDFERLNWQQKIHYALHNNGFVIHYQGIYDTQTQKIEHYESLIRLKDPDNPAALIYPNHFIGIAERNGQILEIDRYVIRNAVQTLAEKSQELSIAINLSGKSFADADLPDFIQAQLREYGVDSSKLLIEITETETIADIQDAIVFIQKLRDIGCHVCLDDFGTGFASFSHLKHLNVDVLKIDGTFIQGLDSSYENRLFVKSMVAVAKGLGMITVAEFVENEAVFNECRQLGIDLVQGYYLGKPMVHFVNEQEK